MLEEGLLASVNNAERDSLQTFLAEQVGVAWRRTMLIIQHEELQASALPVLLVAFRLALEKHRLNVNPFTVISSYFGG